MNCPFCPVVALEPWTRKDGYGPGRVRMGMSAPEERTEGSLSYGPIPLHDMPLVDLMRCPACGFIAAFETPSSQSGVHDS